MSTLGVKQREFAKKVWYLEGYIFSCGFDITHGDSFRDPRATFPYSHEDSCHKHKLARDYNFFRNGNIITKVEDLTHIGEYWESLDERARWGGRFGDAGHFSFEHNGVK